MKALKRISFNTRTEDLQNVLQQGIQQLLPASLRNILNAHYRFSLLKMTVFLTELSIPFSIREFLIDLDITFMNQCFKFRFQSQILKRSLVSLKLARAFAATGKQRKQDQIDDISARMKTLKHNASATIQNLREDVRHEEDQLYEDLVSSLRSRSFTERVFSVKECGKPSSDWRIVAKTANDFISDIISKEVDYWENENQLVGGIKSRILDKFAKEFQVHEDQLNEIESR